MRSSFIQMYIANGQQKVTPPTLIGFESSNNTTSSDTHHELINGKIN